VSGADLDVENADFSGKVAVMIGNEANGLSQQAKEISNSKITINMPGKAESLNAAAAAAIIMWEMLRNV
jgi:TrmH family RNA methyltransferase